MLWLRGIFIVVACISLFMLKAMLRSLNMRFIILLAVILALAVLIVRGCKMSLSPQGADIERGFRGADRTISVYNDETFCIESMSLEKYIVGVVAGEMPAAYDIEALKAQAVAARTYTLRRIESRPCENNNADICTDSKCCQAYCSVDGMRQKWGSADFGAYYDKIRLAVEQTRGEVLFYGDELIEALFHSSAGGQTEASENVYASARPYLRSVESPDSGELACDETVKIEAGEFAQTVNKNYSEAELSPRMSKLQAQIEILSRFSSGRVEQIALGKAKLTGREFRSLFELRSANFTIEFSSGNVIVKTTGYGHGVGMSQRGADAMAKSGMDYREILLHYYTGAEFKTLW